VLVDVVARTVAVSKRTRRDLDGIAFGGQCGLRRRRGFLADGCRLGALRLR
jgi:hypothetical protein